MQGTSKCFFGENNRNVIDQLGPARRLEILSGSPLTLPCIPALLNSTISLKEAIELDFALHTSDNAILIHNKTLYMNLCEKTYFAAGLEMKRIKNRYHARYDLNSLNKRLQWALENSLTQPLEFQIVQGTTQPQESTAVYTVPPLSVSESEFQDWAPHIYEWMGLAILDSPVLCDTSINPAICHYFAYPDSSCQTVYKYSVQGLVTPDYVASVLELKTDWLALCVSGFDHSPIAWNKPHHWDQASEHGYSILKAENEYTFKLISRGDL